MVVPTTTSAVPYSGTGTTAVYPYTWQIAQESDLIVYTEVVATGAIALLALGVGYSVSNVGIQTGGNVTLTAGNLPTGTNLFIASDPAEVQQLLLSQANNGNQADIMAALDLLTRMVQATRRVANNALQIPLVESLAGLNTTFPAAAERAGLVAGFDSFGNVIAAASATGALISAAMIPFVESSTIASARGLLGPYTDALATATGTTTARTLGDHLGDFKSFKDEGAVGDGTTDDTVHIAAALAAGGAWDGGGLTYAVTGNLSAWASNTTVRNATFKQLTPNVGSIRTVFPNSVSNITLKNVKVLRNGAITDGGSTGNDAGMYFSNVPGLLLEDCEVSGDGPGTGINVALNCDYARLVRCYVHDMRWQHGTDPGTEQIIGIWIQNSNYTSLLQCRTLNLTGQIAAGAFRAYQTDGIDHSTTVGATVIGCTSTNVGEGFDTSSSGVNQMLEFVGCRAVACDSWGFKFANTAGPCAITACIAYQCGLGGFLAAGPSSAGLPRCGNITFTNCIAQDTGSNGNWSASLISGFWAARSTFNTYLPDGVFFHGCRALDTQGSPTMKYGFQCDVGYVVGSSRDRNKCVDCYSFGHTLLAVTGFQVPHVLMGMSGSQVIPNTTQTAILWDTEIQDWCDMHRAADGNALITIRENGTYHICGNLQFVANATGERTAKLLLNGGGISVEDHAAGNAAVDTYLKLNHTRGLKVGDTLRIEVVQTSGGSLSVNNTNTTFSVTKVNEEDGL